MLMGDYELTLRKALSEPSGNTSFLHGESGGIAPRARKKVPFFPPECSDSVVWAKSSGTHPLAPFGDVAVVCIISTVTTAQPGDFTAIPSFRWIILETLTLTPTDRQQVLYVLYCMQESQGPQGGLVWPAAADWGGVPTLVSALTPRQLYISPVRPPASPPLEHNGLARVRSKWAASGPQLI